MQPNPIHTMKLKHLLCSALVLFSLASCVVGPGYAGPIGRPVGRPIGGPFGGPFGRPVVAPYGVRPVVVPYGARPCLHGGVRYYNHRGVWYRPYGGGHVICPRPY
jgi:hypothetical protein